LPESAYAGAAGNGKAYDGASKYVIHFDKG
jgi:hypothetical protein